VEFSHKNKILGGSMKVLFNKARRLAGMTGLVFALAGGAAVAATPKDALVVGWQFDDIITLDTAEVFEFSGAEITGNTYDRLIGYDPDDVSKIFGVAAESWTVSEDGSQPNFQAQPATESAFAGTGGFTFTSPVKGTGPSPPAKPATESAFVSTEGFTFTSPVQRDSQHTTAGTFGAAAGFKFASPPHTLPASPPRVIHQATSPARVSLNTDNER
jgi:hypothetical protein